MSSELATAERRDRARTLQTRASEMDDLVRNVSEVERLDEIARASCQLAIWRRGPIHKLGNGLAGLSVDELPGQRVTVSVTSIRDAVVAATANVSNDAARDALVDDVCLLATQFSRLLTLSTVRIRFDATNRQTCPRFHRDHVAARLICTYVGPGTEWGFANTSDRSTEPAKTCQLDPFEVAIFKGELWGGRSRDQSRTIVHRSPSVGGSGHARLAVIIDPADNAMDGTTH